MPKKKREAARAEEGDITKGYWIKEMRMKTKRMTRLTLRGAATFLSAAFMLTALCLFSPATAKAQWTTPDTSSNINSTNSGNVGVGTTTPTRAKVQIIKGSLFNMAGAIEVDDAAGTMDTGLAIGTDGTNHLAWLQSLQPGVSFTTRALVFNPNGGSVGVGTISPGSQFHVANSSGIGAMRVSGSGAAVMNFYDTAAGANRKIYQWRSEGGMFRMSLLNDTEGTFAQQNILVANSSGNVGIGTPSPTAKLHIISADDTVAPALSIRQDTNPLFGFDFTLDTNVNGNLSVNSVNNGVSANVLTIDRAGGKVGISKTNPTEALDVIGNVNASGSMSVTGTITGGNIVAKYQDVAEWVPSEQKLEAGTVVILDAERANHVLASSSSYDMKVAGVISERPGIALGEGGEGKVLVATTGRVKVKVDATKWPIKVGDLLVTSEVEGVAMKSVPVDIGGIQIHRPGTIIGKALEPFAAGTGEILVLLSLQ